MNRSKRSAKYEDKMQGKANLKPTKAVKSHLLLNTTLGYLK